MEPRVGPGVAKATTRLNQSYAALILAFASGFILVFMPGMDQMLPARWAALFILVFFLPGYLSASLILKRTELKSLEIVAIGLGLSLIVFPLTSLALTLYFHIVNQLQVLLAISTIIVTLAVMSSLRDSSKTQLGRSFFHSFFPCLRKYQWILAIIVFAATVRLAAFFLIYRNSVSSDIDMWLVYEIADGKLLNNYTSIWHYLGMAPYSYPILFHLFSASVKNLGQLLPSGLFLINLVPSLIPLLFCYSIIKDSYGERPALISTFALCSAPIFVYDTLPGTFKARVLFYAFIYAELYCASRILKGQKKFWPLLFLFTLASSLTYREAILMNVFIVAVLLSTMLLRSQLRPIRLLGWVSTVLGATLFALSYITYTPSLGLTQTLISGLAKQGPLLIFSLAGVFYSVKRGRTIDHFLSTTTLVMLTAALLNWKAADSAPILLAPLSGVGLIYSFRLKDKIRRFRPSVNLKTAALAIIMVGLITTLFGLTYYPSKYYIEAKPQVFNEIEAIRHFISASKPQSGAIVYGTGYTGLSIKQAYASIFILGPEQETFFYTYSLHHLVSTDFDPWIIKHPEVVYESTLQLHHSLFTHNGEDLRQLLEGFSIQYLIIENTSTTDNWAQSNTANLEERLATQHYKVYEASATKPEVALLRFLEDDLPENAKVLAPHYMAPSINQVRTEYLMKGLKDSFNFNYIHLYERLRGGTNRTKVLDSLMMNIGTLTELYDHPIQLVPFALRNGFDYIVSDNPDTTNKLVTLGQKILFSQSNLALLTANKTIAAQSTNTTNTIVHEPYTLTVNVFDATSFTPERYSLTSPAYNAHVELQRNGVKVGEGNTDPSGTIIFRVPSGGYTVLATEDELTVKRQIKVDSYTFVPTVIHHPKEDPMQKFLAPLLLLVALLASIPSISMRKLRPLARDEDN